jgi:flavin-dependent dehydrogenase
MTAGAYEVAVVGGGPAGSTVAARLAQLGRRVVLFEKDRFPRFHIGESLLPCSMPMFEELGVLDELRARFLPKHAAEFVTADGSLTRRYPFAEGVVPGPGSAFEVERAEFDRILLDNAARCGVDVRQGVELVDFSTGDCAELTVVDVGAPATRDRVRARVLVDATGQRSFIASRFRLRDMDRRLKNFAVFSHFRGADRHTGDREGDISIVLVPHGWWWVIPLRDDKTSVGLVAPGRSLAGRKPDDSYFAEQIAKTPYLSARLARAERIAPVRTTSDYSYSSRRVAGDGWLLVGDAAAFIDPVFSTGVYLGMCEAFRAAQTIDRALARGDVSRRAFLGYERWLRRAVGSYHRFVEGFYTPEFAEVMMYPSDRLQLRQAVTSLLAGHVVDCFPVAWRIAVFRAITVANKHLNLTPRLPGRREAAI